MLSSFTASDLDLEAATSGAIRAYCGWHIAPVVTETLTLDAFGGKKLLLPTKRIVDIHSVKVNERAVECRWSEDGWLTLPSGFPDMERSVVVELKHGYEDSGVLAVLAQVAASMKARAKLSPTGAVVNQRAGTQSVTFASSGGAVASLPLLDQEKVLLAPYKLSVTI
ncbi:hypothetical protein ODZ83_05555 [Acaricomes phytoseiuli]|uniref:hypothetical protein n=1 Tax=Acaricomes phytoseiuli TaxID=291968 RepID=UPI00222302CF|nr:hypothetical protein [Acaricomes phytoseiuli]MCW1249657.1 hypothetical protein [Acaricomes phytoseiuli]